MNLIAVTDCRGGSGYHAPFPRASKLLGPTPDRRNQPLKPPLNPQQSLSPHTGNLINPNKQDNEESQINLGSGGRRGWLEDLGAWPRLSRGEEHHSMRVGALGFRLWVLG